MGGKPRPGHRSVQVALLRGINVGGHRKLPMAELRELLGELDCRNVATYIQSGNAVFDAVDSDDLATRIESAIEARFGFRADVMLRTGDELVSAWQSNPFLSDGAAEDLSQLHVGFLVAEPSSTAIDQASIAPDELRLVGRELFLRTPNGMSRTKLTTRFLAKFGSCTVRNWRTVGRLAAMVTSTSSSGKG